MKEGKKKERDAGREGKRERERDGEIGWEKACKEYRRGVPGELMFHAALTVRYASVSNQADFDQPAVRVQ